MDGGIKYIFLGNLEKKVEIVDYPPNASKSIVENCRKIFDSLSGKKNYKFEERVKVSDNFGDFHFTVLPSKTFYLVLAKTSYPEHEVFKLINELHDNMIYLLVTEKGEISTNGKSKFKDIVDRKMNGSGAIDRAQKDLNEVKIEMKKNITAAVSNIEDVRSLEEKSKELEKVAELMKDNAKKMKCCAWFRNFKWTIIIVTIVIAALIIIIVPIAVTISKQNEAKKAAANGGTSVNVTNIIKPGGMRM